MSREHKEEICRLCERIHHLRITHGLSKKEMAIIMGIQPQALEELEMGILSSRLHIGHIFILCRHFHLSPSFFFDV